MIIETHFPLDPFIRANVVRNADKLKIVGIGCWQGVGDGGHGVFVGDRERMHFFRSVRKTFFIYFLTVRSALELTVI